MNSALTILRNALAPPKTKALVPAGAKTALPAETKAANALMDYARGWYSVVKEPFTGAWQRNVYVDHRSVLSFHAVFACLTLISSDISKLRIKLVEKDADGVWTETSSPAFSPVLLNPNHYQNHIQFKEHWMLSKLTRGNTYILKERDGRGVVTGLYILDPDRVRPLVAYDRSIFYEVQPDNLSGLPERVVIPAREIIHDRMYAGMFNDSVCGVSPLFAAGLPGTHGLNIQNQSARFFANNAQPSTILTTDANARINEADAQRMKEEWKQNFGGGNIGSVAVLAGGLKALQLSMTAVDSQLIEQLKLSAEQVCSAFHIPPHKINAGPQPLNNNVQSLNVDYYTQCLHKLIEDMELCLDEGLGIGDGVLVNGRIIGTELDVDNLLRMDSETQMRTLSEGAQRGILTLDEARNKLGLPSMPGGDTAYMQEQMWPVVTLGQRPVTELKPAKPAETPPVALSPPAAKAIDPEAESLMKAGRAHLAAKYLAELLEAA